MIRDIVLNRRINIHYTLETVKNKDIRDAGWTTIIGFQCNN